jgi:hypothetical protein
MNGFLETQTQERGKKNGRRHHVSRLPLIANAGASGARVGRL